MINPYLRLCRALFEQKALPVPERQKNDSLNSSLQQWQGQHLDVIYIVSPFDYFDIIINDIQSRGVDTYNTPVFVWFAFHYTADDCTRFGSLELKSNCHFNDNDEFEGCAVLKNANQDDALLEYVSLSFAPNHFHFVTPSSSSREGFIKKYPLLVKSTFPLLSLMA